MHTIYSNGNLRLTNTTATISPTEASPVEEAVDFHNIRCKRRTSSPPAPHRGKYECTTTEWRAAEGHCPEVGRGD